MLTIIVPCFNEIKTIEELLDRVQNVFLSGIQKQVIVVDDGSTDGTFEYLSKRSDIELLHHKNNKGKTQAIRTALPYVMGEAVLIQDADLEYDPQDYSQILVPLLQGQTSVVYGCRPITSTKYLSTHGPIIYLGRLVASLVTNLFYHRHIKDVFTCYKLFDRRVLQAMQIEGNGFEFCAELTGKLLSMNLQIREVSISYLPRPKSEGKKMRLIDGMNALLILVKNRLRDPLDRGVDKLPYLKTFAIFEAKGERIENMDQPELTHTY